jgi:two-component sensor histidine kinase
MPPLLVFLMNGAGLTAFYRHDQALRSRIRERQLVINETFDAIHNGPLQTLSRLLSQSRDESLTRSDTRMGLQELDREVRGIYESMQEAVGASDEMLYVSQDLRVNLREPMPEVLRQVYEDVLARNWPHLQTVKLKLVDFQPIDERWLDLGMRRDLCRFLEEAITNVGKHGVGTTRLEVRCEVKDGLNMVRVADNGAGNLGDGLRSTSGHREGMGTQQAKRLAKRLRGEFERGMGEPQGMVCQLSWKPQRRWFG